MIQHGYELDFSNQNFGVILYGAPGVGKTTLALSDGNMGADTLLIDLEHGVGRTNPMHRLNASILNAATYEDVLADLDTPEAKQAKTIVIDTAGSLVDYLKDWAMRTKNDAKTKNGTWNGLKGFGYVKTEIESFVSRIKNVMGKNIVFIFHSDEKQDRDGNPIQRLRCEGAFRNTVWTGIDFGGYVSIQGGRRYVNFSPDDDSPAKGCHGVEGKMEIPTLSPTAKNNFLATLFAKARATMQAENDAVAKLMDGYQNVIAAAKQMLMEVDSAEKANECLKALREMEHFLTSKKETAMMLNEKCIELGLRFDKANNSYVTAGDKP